MQWFKKTDRFLDSLEGSKTSKEKYHPSRVSPKFAILSLVWLLTAASFTVAMIQYSKTPSIPDNPPSIWPTNNSISLNLNNATLLLFAHPHCPCTIATIDELEKLLAKCDGLVSTYFVLVKPDNTPPDWTETRIKRAASKIPGVNVIVDKGGELTSRFGCKTSGSTLLYGYDGALLFHGGITAERGNSGDNAGSDAIWDILHSRKPALTDTPVFGCGLLDSMCTMGDVN